MKSEETLRTPAQPKLREIIVITDNRENKQHERGNSAMPLDKAHFDFRSSAFKETEVDPLQFQRNQFNYTQDEELMAELNRRITDLEQRVEALESKQGAESEVSRPCEEKRRRKVRRRNSEMKRDRVCCHCGKNYGTDTALKYHIKLKHGVKKN